MRRVRLGYVVWSLATALALGACTGDDAPDAGPADPGSRSSGETTDDAFASGPDCTARALADGDELVSFTTAHRVTGGALGPPCLGEEDDLLLEAWYVLETISPPDFLEDLSLLAGYETDDDSEFETLAYVFPLDDDHTGFQMSINLVAAADDLDEYRLTVAHEFAHVFTEAADQYDFSSSTCSGWEGAEGCHPDGSWLDLWVDAFWPAEVLDEVDIFADPDPSDGDERCSIDPGYLGPYAASNVEEDFGESFSAFVFDVDAPAIADKIAFFAAQPELAAFRDRARAAGLTPIANTFEGCG